MIDIIRRTPKLERKDTYTIRQPQVGKLEGTIRGELYYLEVGLPQIPIGTAAIAPSDIVSVVWDEKVYFSWSQVGAVLGWNVQILDGTDPVIQFDTNEQEFILDSELVNDTEYSCIISAYTPSGILSANPVLFTPSSKQPQNVVIDSIIQDTAEISWDAVTGDVLNYTVRVYNTDTEENEQVITGITDNTVEIENISYGAPYEIYVQAISELEIFVSAESVPAAVQPDAPTNVAVEVVDSSLNTASLSFDEDNDYVDIPHISAYEVESHTIAFWCKIASDSTSNPKGLFHKSLNTSFGNNSGFNCHLGLGGIIQWLDITVSGTQIDLRSATTGFNDDDWHRIAGVVRKNSEGNTTWELWIDGVLEDSETLSENPEFNTEKITLGRVSSSSLTNRYLKGGLDEVQFWSKALTEQELLDTDIVLEGNEEGLIGYWNCEDESGTLTDITANANHGAITGAIYSSDVPNIDVGVRANLTWDSVADVDGYNVYLNKDGAGYVKQNTSLISPNEYTIEDLEDGSYEAYVTAVKNGAESEPSNVVEFKLPLGEIVYSTDFSEFPLGNSPTELTSLWDAYGAGTTGDLIIDNDFPTTPIVGNRFLRESNNLSGSLFQRQFDAAQIPDGELLVLQYHNSSSRTVRSYIRMSQLDLSSANGYICELAGGNTLRIRKITGGSLSTIASVTYNYSIGSYQWMRVNFDGSNLKVKVWGEESLEPSSWNIDTTDTTYTDGYVGVGVDNMNLHNSISADYFAVSNGITIPLPE